MSKIAQSHTTKYCWPYRLYASGSHAAAGTITGPASDILIVAFNRRLNVYSHGLHYFSQSLSDVRCLRMVVRPHTTHVFQTFAKRSNTIILEHTYRDR